MTTDSTTPAPGAAPEAPATTVESEARWLPIFPVGYPSAIDSMGSVAAPLLASVSGALVTFVATNEDKFRWPTAALLLLVAATLALIQAVQFTFRAKQYDVTPSQLQEWWPNDLTMVRRYQRYHHARFLSWSNKAKVAYDVGIVCLLLALTAIITPKGAVHHFSDGRLALSALALAGATIEALWVIQARWPRKRQLVLPEVGPEWTPGE